jgi:hypothetical protein
MKEITDGMKADLEKVCCSAYQCSERGDYARCYLDIYKNCIFYKALEKIKEKEKR